METRSLATGELAARIRAYWTLGGLTMILSVTDQERELMLELLTSKQNSMLHELHHTDTYDYKELLKEKLEVLEKVLAKIRDLETSSFAGQHL
jgi:hypothetical protein